MPEGHTLHRMALDHSKWLGGDTLRVSSPQGRFSEGAEFLDGAEFVRASAVGKHLLWHFRGLERPRVVHIHLGLFGRFRRYVRKVPEPRGAIRVRLQGNRCTLDLSGPTVCELLTHPQVGALRQRLGPDTLDPKADPERAWAKIKRSRRSVGALLLDQSVLAGVGNVYRAELLFLHRIPPDLSGRELPKPTFDALWLDTVRLLQVGVFTNKIITRGVDEEGGHKSGRRERLWVYKERRCHLCAAEIRKMQTASRTLYFCPVCQGHGPG